MMPAGVSERFWAKVDKRGPDECWLWTASLFADGYGQFRNRKAPRVAWELANGRIPDGLHVCHRCDSPACVNPAHLWLGDAWANMADMARKGRAGNQHGGQAATHCIHGHEYTPENTYWRSGKVASRDCRACIRSRVAKYKREKAA